MRPDDYLAHAADKAALIVADREYEATLTYMQMCRRSRQLAAYLRSRSLKEGDTVAILLENRIEVAEAVWAVQRSGLRYTLINHHLHPDEARYIVEDCDAVALIVSNQFAPLVSAGSAQIAQQAPVRLVIDADVAGFDRFESVFSCATPDGSADLDDAVEGAMMLYSSGTTGRPKGIRYNHPRQKFGELVATENLLRHAFGMDESSVLLVAGPLYHAAPISWTMGAHRVGATVVALERFDALECLRLIERHRVTHVLMVPTHFVRLLKLSDEERRRHSLSSLRCVVHAAAPCPIDVKERMLEWWGEIVYEFYSSTEANGFVMIGPQEWRAHKGSVGKVTQGRIHIADESGNALPPGEPGVIWFESAGLGFAYHKDEKKTREAYDVHGRSTVGDIGFVDEAGYLYLTDRKSNMIISGGVNIYPQEIESLLALHPAILDIAVVGAPHAEFGEEVVAVVVPAEPARASDALARELIDYCRDRMAHYKCPRSVRFMSELPRSPAGKLMKRLLKL